PGRPPDPSLPDPAVRPPDEDVHAYRLRVAGLLLAPPGLATAATVVAADNPRGVSPLWASFEPTARALGRLQEALRKSFDDDHTGYFQFQLEVWPPAANPANPADRTTVLVRSARLGKELPRVELPPDQFAGFEDRLDRVDGADESVRRAVTAQAAGRPLFFAASLHPQAVLPAPARRPPDVLMVAFVQHARSVAELDALLAVAEQDREDQLAHVGIESRRELAWLRTRLGGIVGVTFLATVVGGLVIVARGLSPLRKLSHAVSQVSEKDFRLPVGPDGLSRELAPIHTRLTSTLDQLRRAFEREKEAVADISHELRTPIASLLATIDVALRRPRSPDHYRATLEDCRAIAKQLGHLVERIMTLASLDAGTARVAVARADAAEVAAGCGTVIRPLAEAHGLAFAVSAPDPVELDTDPDRLREVLINLLHNAVEYNRPGGRVELAVRRDAGRVLFEVADTGIGMPDEVREKMFERFYRADPSRHATGVHAGLGLAIVKEYVGRLGGTIEVDSTPGEGSTFRVSFPAPPARPAEPPPPARREPAAARS
ncbi:MAG: HAMP domain-containing histidine kinase, partial [Gemmataceae bacterium]|nr:HAMP domain-containing histidine kinase [Gemmataceae bacterium]